MVYLFVKLEQFRFSLRDNTLKYCLIIPNTVRFKLKSQPKLILFVLLFKYEFFPCFLYLFN